VDASDYSATRQHILENGYRLASDWGWESSLVDDDRGVCVDVHRAITPDEFPVRFRFSSLYDRLQSVAIGGRPFRVLCTDDMLLVLCVQLCKDVWGRTQLRLSKVCDIAELLRSRGDLDWPYIHRAARRLGCQRMISLALTVSHQLLGAPVPESVLARAHTDSRLDTLVAETYQDLFQPSDTYTASLSSEKFYFTLRERWRDKLFPYYRDFRLRLIPNERDHAFLPLPESLRHLYYLIRPIRLARDNARKLLRVRKPH
jgi:hypothetical protein